MKFSLPLLAVLTAYVVNAANTDTEFAIGRTYYEQGEFKKAAAHFQLALKTNPDDAGACYWTGLAYQRLADIATPFGGRYNSKARDYLARAVSLSPNRADYRLELFNHLLDSADAAHTRPSQAAEVVLGMSESDPEYLEMRRRFEDANRLSLSVDAFLAKVVLFPPRAAYDIAALPASALSRLLILTSQPALGW